MNAICQEVAKALQGRQFATNSNTAPNPTSDCGHFAETLSKKRKDEQFQQKEVSRRQVKATKKCRMEVPRNQTHAAQSDHEEATKQPASQVARPCRLAGSWWFRQHFATVASGHNCANSVPRRDLNFL